MEVTGVTEHVREITREEVDVGEITEEGVAAGVVTVVTAGVAALDVR